MLYHSLKILHIISATLLLTSMAYSIHLWRRMKLSDNIALTQRIQTHTLILILPAAIFQLLSGFTILSVQHEALSQPWIHVSIFGFFIVISSWIGFVYSVTSHLSSRKRQQYWLIICLITLASMIFFMANKI